MDANRKAVNRDTVPPSWRSTQKYLGLLFIQLKFIFQHPVYNLMTTRDQFLIAFSVDSRSVCVCVCMNTLRPGVQRKARSLLTRAATDPVWYGSCFHHKVSHGQGTT